METDNDGTQNGATGCEWAAWIFTALLRA